MIILISPAKQMRETELQFEMTKPVFIEKKDQISKYLRSLSYEELKTLWECSDKIASDAYPFVKEDSSKSPALLSYDGIAFKYMAPVVFSESEFSYVQDKLRILSAMYGILKPMDEVSIYRLEMQAKAKVNGSKNLYEYWGSSIYDEIAKNNQDKVIINLASKEYSKAVEKYLTKDDIYITCTFAEEENDKLIQKGVYCKMARGEMVRFMAENNISLPEQLKEFKRLGFSYREDLSDERNFIFIKQ